MTLGGTPTGTGPSASGGTGNYSYSWLPAFGLSDPAAEHPVATPPGTISYQLTVTDVTSGCVSASPSTVTVTVNPKPVIISSPAPQVKCVGDQAVFSASATGSSFQWEVSTNNGVSYTDVSDDATYDNVTTTSLTVNNVQYAMNGYLYRLRINALPPCNPDHTLAASLTVNKAPVITMQPSDAGVCQGGSVTFSSTASDATGYQWLVSTNGGTSFNTVVNGGNYTGANTNTLSILNIPPGFNNYKYKMIASGSCNPAAESNVVTLTVNTNLSITSQPAALQSVKVNSYFHCYSTGTGPVSY